jgi:dihydrofolate synthase/folylpolyglutamate synthase
VLLDGSHNPNGTEALYGLLKKSGITKAVGILGFMADKDVADALEIILSCFSKVYTVTVESNSRAMSAENLASLCETLGTPAEAVSDYQTAIKKALSDESDVVVFGSLYLAGDIYPYLLENMPSDDKTS